jgi:hypothetical protein
MFNARFFGIVAVEGAQIALDGDNVAYEVGSIFADGLTLVPKGNIEKPRANVAFRDIELVTRTTVGWHIHRKESWEWGLDHIECGGKGKSRRFDVIEVPMRQYTDLVVSGITDEVEYANVVEILSNSSGVKSLMQMSHNYDTSVVIFRIIPWRNAEVI